MQSALKTFVLVAAVVLQALVVRGGDSSEPGSPLFYFFSFYAFFCMNELRLTTSK